MEWDPTQERVSVREEVEWMLSDGKPKPPPLDTLRSWMREGRRKLDISDENRFCDAEVLSSILKCKTVFDHLEAEEMRKARTRSNPFETIRGAFFLNRAALKMANMDAVFDFMFTSPSEKGQILVFITRVNPTNIASVDLVMGCPNSRAGVIK